MPHSALLHPNLQRLSDVLQAKPGRDKYHMARCIAHRDNSPSLSIWDNGKQVRFKCFAECTEKEIIDKLIIKGFIKDESDLLTGQYYPDLPAKTENSKEKWQPIPVPDKQAFDYKPKKANYSDRYFYHDIHDKVVQIIYRYDLDNGKKEFSPFTFCRNIETEERQWLNKAIANQVPPYRAQILYECRNRTVIFCEGEKAANALQYAIKPVQFTVTTTAGGSNSAHKTDFSLFRNMDVVVWPDADNPGRKYASEIVKFLKQNNARSIKVIIPPENAPEGWDAADAVDEGYDEEKLLEMINSAVPADQVLLPSDPIIEEINQEYAVLKKGGQKQIMRITYHQGNRQIDFITLQNMRVNLAPKGVVEGNGDHVKYWVHHPDRRQYEGVIFEPGEDVPDFFNLWQGFTIEAKEGDISKFIHLITTVIANGDKKLSEYILDWMANIVQNPKIRPGVALVMHGDEGIGKGVAVSYFGSLFGEHFLQAINDKHILHHFNFHLQGCLVLFADEALWAGDKKTEGVLKGMITEKEMIIEGKGRDAYRSSNYIHMIMSSNNTWIVPAGHGARRFVVCEVNNKYKGNFDYFKAITDEMENGGKEALLHFLQKRDISKANLRDIPKTNALRDQKILSMPSVSKFWYGRLCAGSQVPASDEWMEAVVLEELVEAYVKTARKSESQYSNEATSFGMQFTKYCNHYEPKRKLTQITDKDGKPRSKNMTHYIFGSLQECREDFDKYYNTKFEWPDTEPVATDIWGKSISKNMVPDDAM